MRRVLALACMCLVLAGAACTDDGPVGSDAVVPIARAAARTTESGSAEVFFGAVVTLDAAQAPAPIEFTGEGEFDYEERVGNMTFDLSAFLEESQIQQGGTAEAVFDGYVVYMKFPWLESLLPPTRPWVRIDYEELSKDQRGGLTQLSQLGQGDPSSQLELLKGASDRVEEVGTEEVRGETTTHYSLTVDLEKVAQEVPDPLRPEFEDLMDESRSKTLPVDVWLDEQGRVRRLSYVYEAVSTAATGDQVRGETEVTLELFDFGTEVISDTPSEAEVVDFEDLLDGPTP